MANITCSEQEFPSFVSLGVTLSYPPAVYKVLRRQTCNFCTVGAHERSRTKILPILFVEHLFMIENSIFFFVDTGLCALHGVRPPHGGRESREDSVPEGA